MRFADVTTTSSVPAASSKRVQADPSSAPSDAAPAGPCGPAGPCAPAGPAGPAGPAWPAAPAAPAGPIGPAGPAAPQRRVALRPLETCRPRSASRAGRALRARRATLVPRDDALVPPTVVRVAHHAEEPLARLLAADDHAVGLRPRSRERRRARELRIAVTPAMTIARPYTSRSLRRCRRPSYPRHARAARCPNGTCALDSAWLSGDVDSPAPTRDEGWSASARI